MDDKSIDRLSKVEKKPTNDTETDEVKFPLKGHLEIDDLSALLDEEKTKFEKSLKSDLVQPSAEISDFEILRVLGKGSYGRVYLVLNSKTSLLHAMKVIELSQKNQKKHLTRIEEEKTISHRLNFPFILYCEYSFSNGAILRFISPFIAGGELLHHLSKKGKFNEEQSKFFIAQVVLALEYLHYLNVVHRDLKPENLLMNVDGYLKLTDFGFAKILQQRTYTFCGTPEYIAPEVVLSKGHGLAVDWWALGVLSYEMNCGLPPFRATKQMSIFERVIKKSFRMPTYFSAELKDLISQFLQIDLTRRLGNLRNGVNDIKDHPWFVSTSWLCLLNRTIVAPYIPVVQIAEDSLTPLCSECDDEEIFEDF